MAELHYEKGKCQKEKLLLFQCLLDENIHPDNESGPYCQY